MKALPVFRSRSTLVVCQREGFDTTSLLQHELDPSYCLLPEGPSFRVSLKPRTLNSRKTQSFLGIAAREEEAGKGLLSVLEFMVWDPGKGFRAEGC